MGDFVYADRDDFQKAAARILKFAHDGLQDAQSRLASEGFFKRAKLAATFAPSMKLLRRVLAPVVERGSVVYKNAETAEAYCRSMSEVLGEYGDVILDSGDPGAKRLVATSIYHLMQMTAEVLTKKAHDECWYGNEGLADDLRRVFAT